LPQLEDFLMEIFFSLPFAAGTANTPENIRKNEVFYRAIFLVVNKKTG
jgi:hypothetical protein